MIGAFQAGLLASACTTCHRYWRLLATDFSWDTSAGQYHEAAKTISFFASTDGTGTDLCLGETASASSIFSETYNASQACDGTDATWWSTALAQSTYQRWWIDLGAGGEADVCSVGILAYPILSSIYLGKAQALQHSDNGTDWTTKSTKATTDTQSYQVLSDM